MNPSCSQYNHNLIRTPVTGSGMEGSVGLVVFPPTLDKSLFSAFQDDLFNWPLEVGWLRLACKDLGSDPNKSGNRTTQDWFALWHRLEPWHCPYPAKTYSAWHSKVRAS